MENRILKSVRFNAFVIKVLSLFAVIIFSSCNGGDGIVKCEMPKSVALSGRDAKIEVMGALDLKVVDTMLVITTMKTTGFWSFYSLDDKEHMGDFLSKGNSDKEFLGKPIVGTQHFEKDENGNDICYIYDFRKGGFKRFNMTKSIRENSLDIVPMEIKIPATVFSWTMLDFDNIVISEPDESRTFERRSLLSNNQRIEKPVFAIFEDMVTKPDGDINDIGTFMGHRPHLNRIVECGKKLNRIYLYDIDGGFSKILSVKEDVPSNVSIVIETSPELKQDCFRYLECFDDCFCVLFSGNDALKEETSPQNSKIFVFDWEGTPIISINLDRAVTSFSFDWPRKKLYTLNFRTEEISEFDISQLDI